MKRRYYLLAALGLALGLGIPLWLGGGEVWSELAQLSWQRLAALLLMIFACWNINAARLRLLAGGIGTRLRHGRALAIIMATEFAICATPGGSGGPPTYAWLLRSDGLGGSQALAMYAADQLLNMLFFLTALVTLLAHWTLVPSGLHLGWQMTMLGGVLTVGLTLVGLSLRHYRPVMLAAGRLLRHWHVSQRTRLRLARWAIEFRHSLRLIQGSGWRRLLGLSGLCVVHWLLRYSVLYLAVQGLGGTLSWGYAFVVQMLSLTAGQATLLPGGSGGAEASSSLLLAPYLGPSTAAAAILVWRFVTFYWYLIAGAPVFVLLTARPLWRRLTGGGD